MNIVCRYLLYLTFPLATLAVVTNVRAQSITSDGTLSTQVQSNDNLNFDITQGNRQGNNLFHSFKDFGVPNNGSARFLNQTDIANIFSRVTGGNISEINGLLEAQGTANLFLINPRGIVFGPNASLNVGGSFFASTASGILFNDGVEFSATDTQPSPLLSVNIPIGLRFRDNPGSITNRSIAQDVNGNTVGLQVLPGNTLALIGGNIDILEGGRITAPEARIELAGLAEAGIIELENISNSFKLNFPANTFLSNVTLADDARVAVRGNSQGDIAVNTNIFTALRGGRLVNGTEGTLDGGDITVNSNEFNISGLGQSGLGAGVYQQVIANASGNLGKIAISTNSFNASSKGMVINEVRPGGIGNAGDTNIQAQTISLSGGAQIAANTWGFGNAGKINIVASEEVSIVGFAQPNAGVNQGFILSGILSNVESGGTGNAGEMNLSTKNLFVRDGAQVQSLVRGEGNGGKINIVASEKVSIVGKADIDIAGTQGLFFPSAVLASVESGGKGNGGKVNIKARNLSITKGAQVITIVRRAMGNLAAGEGKAGNIIINVDDKFELDGVSDIVNINGLDRTFPSLLTTSLEPGTTDSEAAGNITITTDDFRISNGAKAEALTSTSGAGGKITINAKNFIATDGGQILTTTSNSGSAGDIKLNISESVTISGSNSGIFANTAPGSTGNGGNISIDPKTVEILDGARISADSQGTGKPGNIDIQVDELLLLRRGGTISTNSAQDTDGGNININTGVLVAFPEEDSDITSNAVRGKGGKIDIKALGIFGIVPRPFPTKFSDITANSEFGVSGTVTINNPEVDPNSGLIELPQTVVDAKNQIAQNACRQGVGSELVATGRGGLPPNPTQDLRSSAVRVDLATPVTSNTTNTIASKPQPTPTVKKIVPAQGWVFNSKGQVVLTAYNPNQIGVQRTANKALCREK